MRMFWHIGFGFYEEIIYCESLLHIHISAIWRFKVALHSLAWEGFGTAHLTMHLF